MSRMQLTGITIIMFNVASIVTLMYYSHGQVFLLTVMSVLTTCPVIVSEIYKNRLLVETKQKQYTILFLLLIMFGIYYSFIALLLLVYFKSNDSLNSKWNCIVVGSLTYNWNVICNLTFYGCNGILYWTYVGCFHRMFWINSIREIFQILKRQHKERNESLLDCLKPIQITPQVLESICALCLEEYKKQEQVSKLLCRHYFHRECIRVWIFRNSSCPLCRMPIILY